MNYIAYFLVILVCCGAYYSYTIQDQRVTEVEQQLTDQQDKLTSLRADNAKLNDELAAANEKLKTTAAAPVPPAASPAQASAVTNASAATPSTVKSNLMTQGIVVIKGDNAEGTGFFVKTAEGPAIVTNLHVLSNNPHVKIVTNGGVPITMTGMKGATDRDLAMLTIADGPYTYLPLASNVSQTVQTGDADLTPGNSQGGDVVLSTPGKLLAVGPDRVEFDNPIYHGNSGGPVIHTNSNTVVGVVTEAMKVDMTNDLDKASFASRNSAISTSMRYFALRIDTVSKWEVYDPAHYQNETAFIDDFNKQSRALDSYLNTKSSSSSGGSAAAASADDNLYERDEKIMNAHHTFRQQLAAGDTASQINALRELGFSLGAIADRGMEAMKNPNNFYSFDQQRVRDEIAYRNALKKEIQDFSSNVNRIGDLPRTND